MPSTILRVKHSLKQPPDIAKTDNLIFFLPTWLTKYPMYEYDMDWAGYMSSYTVTNALNLSLLLGIDRRLPATSCWHNLRRCLPSTNLGRECSSREIRFVSLAYLLSIQNYTAGFLYLSQGHQSPVCKVASVLLKSAVTPEDELKTPWYRTRGR